MMINVEGYHIQYNEQLNADIVGNNSQVLILTSSGPGIGKTCACKFYTRLLNMDSLFLRSAS